MWHAESPNPRIPQRPEAGWLLRVDASTGTFLFRANQYYGYGYGPQGVERWRPLTVEDNRALAREWRDAPGRLGPDHSVLEVDASKLEMHDVAMLEAMVARMMELIDA